jgi:colanic acid biosynthesis glycosyl transferase WcaI
MWMYRGSDRIVVMHEQETSVLTKFGIDSRQIEVIPHGRSWQSEPAPRDAPKLILPRRQGRILLVYAGTIGLVHGLPDFLDSFADDRIRNLPVDLVIVGDGQFRRECLRIIALHQLENVTILPPVSPFQVPEMLEQADVLLCTFRNQDNVPLSSKFYDYCWAGKPILVYGHNLAGELVKEIGNGVSCLAGDRDGLCRALSELLTEPGAWRGKGERGRAYALENYSQALRDAQWESLITSVGAKTRDEDQWPH